MRITTMRSMLVLLCAGFCSVAIADEIPSTFRATWGVDAAGTAEVIHADPEMTSENKTYWAERFKEGPESKMQLMISKSGLEIAGFGVFSLVEILEESTTSVRFLSLVRDPGSGQEMELTVTLAERGDGTLNVQVDSGGMVDDDDFDRIVWARLGEAQPVAAKGGVVEYLQSLEQCAPGEFVIRVGGMGDVRSVIEGPNGDRCRVVTEVSDSRLVCDYSQETISLLTSAEKYEDARSGILQGSTDSPESKRASEECALE